MKKDAGEWRTLVHVGVGSLFQRDIDSSRRGSNREKAGARECALVPKPRRRARAPILGARERVEYDRRVCRFRVVKRRRDDEERHTGAGLRMYDAGEEEGGSGDSNDVPHGQRRVKGTYLYIRRLPRPIPGEAASPGRSTKFQTDPPRARTIGTSRAPNRAARRARPRRRRATRRPAGRAASPPRSQAHKAAAVVF